MALNVMCYFFETRCRVIKRAVSRKLTSCLISQNTRIQIIILQK